MEAVSSNISETNDMRYRSGLTMCVAFLSVTNVDEVGQGKDVLARKLE